MSAFHFKTFYETWLDQLQHMVDELYPVRTPPSTPDENQKLRHLVVNVTAHHAEYFRVKALAAGHDILTIFTAPWVTTLERAFLWVAGWRPTVIFHLIYTESSVLFESHIIDILRGHRTGDLGDLTPAQFRRVSELQCETVREENGITDELAEWQDSTVELPSEDGDIEGRMKRLVVIVRKADELRLRTLTKVVEMLTPQQAVEFLIAASELMFGVHGWGLEEDNKRSRNSQ